jgi:FkbM family methyltransferase
MNPSMDRNQCSLARMLGESAPIIRIVDVGALWLGEGNQPYSSLLCTGAARVVGFEPIAAECEALNRRFEKENHVYLPYAIGDGSRNRFHRCNFDMTSSLLEPDLSWMDLFCDLSRYCQVVSVGDVQTRRLDDVPEISGVDYLKIDVQGAELDVLRGATRVLKDALVIQTEIEFIPIYRDQPLFADIDQFLRARDFMFHRFVNTQGRALRLSESEDGTPGSGGQLLWGDAVYIRPIPDWVNLDPENLLRLAVILHELYKSFDFSARLLQIYDERTGSAYFPEYLQMVESVTSGNQG